MTKPAQPWTRSLEDSMFALGGAARECQAAARAAALTTGHYDLDRLRLLDGKILRRHPAYTGEQDPHLAALSQIGRIQLHAQHRLERLYEEATRAYAHGGNWAIGAVLAGERPAYVVLPVTADNAYDLGTYMPTLALERYSQAAQLEAARRAYERCITARCEAEEIDGQDYVSDHDAGEMHAALDIAAGLPDAAYAYGLLAESALRWTLTNTVDRQ
ncbi:hypothetical protein ABTY96_46700 [Streptomyces sp. NPDC096057]|uniref:hypothetical protein n=1 Tax=Streptomyces sp. NPDC096057 TaxID=3155543 RepID=UPI00331D8EEC